MGLSYEPACPCGLPGGYGGCCGRFHGGGRDPATRWTRLEVLGCIGGGVLDSRGTVEFRAHHGTGVVAEAAGSTSARCEGDLARS